jgi:hypothetical protein
MSRIATAVDIHLVQTSGEEWEVRVDPSWDCVGYITHCGGCYEAIDVLPPYEVALVDDLDEALERITGSLGQAGEALLGAYTAAHTR